MKISNKYNLPEVFVNMANNIHPIKENEISITDLINPPYMYKLKLKCWDQLEQDVSETLWMLLGTAIHMVLDKHSPDDSLSEEKIEVEIDGVKIKGRPDLYKNNSIEDYKVTSVYSFLLGEKKEWENQLNCYAWLYEKIGFKVEKLFINAILRDWVKTRTKENNYPEIPFLKKEIPLWDFEKREKYIRDRIVLFKQDPEICSEEDRWKRGGEIALMQEGRKSAIKLFNNEDETKNIKLNKNQYFEKRPVKYVRCEEYCLVRNFCEFGKRRLQNE